MAGSLTDVWEKKVLDLIFRNTNASATTPAGLDASNLYVALFTTAPTDSTTGTEVSGGSYARVAVARSGTPGWTAASGTTALTDNSGAITFTTASADWGTIVAAGICNSSAGALSTDLIAWATLAVNKTVTTGDTFSFATGDLDITLD